MKKIFILAAAAATLFSFASCKKDAGVKEAPEAAAQAVKLTVGIVGSQTKATGIDDSNYPATEAKVNNLQVLIFKDNGLTLDGYATVTADPSASPAVDAKSVTVDCTAGERKIYAVVNAPSLAAIAKESDLLSTVSVLANEISNFKMIGNVSATLKQDSAINIDVKRLASRIVLKSVKNSLPNATQAASFYIKGVYLTNVAADVDLGLSASYSIANWYNKRGFQSANNLGNFTFDDIARVKVESGASYSVQHNLYAYPNAATDRDCKYAALGASDADRAAAYEALGADAAAREAALLELPLPTTWSPRSSRLVVKAEIDGEDYVYPIQLPVLQSNKSYEINILELTRLGNKSDGNEPTDGETSEEEDDVKSIQQAFQITVLDWDVVLVNSEGETGGHFVI